MSPLSLRFEMMIYSCAFAATILPISNSVLVGPATSCLWSVVAIPKTDSQNTLDRKKPKHFWCGLTSASREQCGCNICPIQKDDFVGFLFATARPLMFCLYSSPSSSLFVFFASMEYQPTQTTTTIFWREECSFQALFGREKGALRLPSPKVDTQY